MKKHGIWIRRGILPYYLQGENLALALLLRENPRTAAQLADCFAEKGISCDRAALEKVLAALERLGVVTAVDSVYTCNAAKLGRCDVDYSEAQLLDLIGMTQSTLNGRAFYTAAPPMSSSSNNGNIL